MGGVTLDTGALIGLERSRTRVADASVTIDALVMASAARRGDVVYTADMDDLRRFQPFFPGVRVLAV
jgi:hypothetical protein